MLRPALLLPALLLAGCAGPAFRAPGDTSPGATQNRFARAVVAPLSDLNLLRTEVPPVLLEARKAPYAPPRDLGCAALAADVLALDMLLGSDFDAPQGPEASFTERGGEAVTDAAVRAVRSTTEGILPFRSWIRRLSGAERSDREVAAAIAAGTVRRAYLKGIAHSTGCAGLLAAPPAPGPAPAPSLEPAGGPPGPAASAHLPPAAGSAAPGQLQ